MTVRADTGRRSEVLRVLRDAARPMDAPEIAERLGVHVNTVRFHLENLAGNGQVERTTGDRRGPGRPPLMFQAVRRMDPAGARHYRLLAEILAANLAGTPDPTLQATQAGLHWARSQQPPPTTAPSAPAAGESVGLLMEMLGGLGFAPEELPSDGLPRIGLRHCPFLELAEDRSDVVCAVHLGLMQGAMESWQSHLTVDSLQPFAQPDLCIAHLARK